MTTVQSSLDLLCVNSIRTLAIDTVQQANSGHPGLPMGAAPMAYALWQRHLRHDPSDPSWPDRDRFVLSAGHGSALLYVLLHVTGYDLSIEDLKGFRQWGSKTPGHPEFHETPGVEATTGPLGQGSANAVGMALAERLLAARFNKPGHTIVDHHTYALVSDGDLMEGLSGEAASLAGHLQLGKLIYLYDCNGISLDGPTSLAFDTEDVGARYRAYGWQVLEVKDGDTNVDAIDRALSEARRDSLRPTLILVRTTIGYGSPAKQGTSEAHGSPLGPKEVALTKEKLGFDPTKSFEIPADARAHLLSAKERGAAAHRAWKQRFDSWAKAFPELAAEWRRTQARELPADFAKDLPVWETGAQVATRDAGGKAQNALAARLPEFLGGDADLSCSTKTALEKGGSVGRDGAVGRNLHFGVREHAMGSIANGMLYHGGLRPFVSTFFVFSDYMRPPVRLAALSHLPLISVWTHDSVAVGEDGPTHQPVEHLASLRAMPQLTVIRPCDANETAHAWRVALQQTARPTCIVLSRQKLPVLPGTKEKAALGVERGAYVLAEAEGGAPQLILMGTGSELQWCMAARQLLAKEGLRARVVSMPAWDLFQAQDASYRESVLPHHVKARVSVEAGATFGWERWVGDHGVALGIDRFGASAPGEMVLERFGFTVERVAAAGRESFASVHGTCC
jgi:transketolase